jgi:hypothetical protein
VLRWAWRWFFRNWRRNLQRVSTTTAVMTLVRQIALGKPETVFRGRLEPGTGIRIRVRDRSES